MNKLGRKLADQLLKMEKKIAHGITGNKLRFEGELYKCNKNGKNYKIKRIHYEPNPESIWYGLDWVILL